MPHLQAGTRPYVVISNNRCNKYSPIVTVIPITTQNKKSLPTHYTLSESEIEYTGLDRESTILGESITAINKDLILSKIGELHDLTKRSVTNVIRTQLGMA